MKELIAFILPPATALAGARLCRWLLGEKFEAQFGAGFRFVLGLAVGMLVFSQAVLLGALAGVNLAGWLAWLALIWGAAEVVLLLPKATQGLKQIKFQPGHLWLLLLLPVIYSWWVFGRLSTLEGTLQFDANAFWVFKAKILFLEQGKNFINTLHQSNLGYAHMDHPWLVPGLYTLDYGAVGGVDEFVNKVWPFWMMVSLSAGILSLGNVWKRPHPLPVVIVTVLGFLPATMEFIRQEGGTVPSVFYLSLMALLLVNAISRENIFALAIAISVMAGCAMVRIEGIVFSLFWLGALLPFCWKRGWLKQKLVRKSALAAAVCVLPFIWYRLIKPVPYPLSSWWHALFASPGSVLACYPRALFLYILGRFFNSEFFHWLLKDNIHLQWDGKWLGLNSLVNEQLAVLPWLLLVLLVFSVWKKREWPALLCLTLAMLGIFAFLPFVISCLSYTQSDTPNVADFSYAFNYYGSGGMGRYFYPFFTAWFLGIAALWFDDPQPSPSAATPNPPRNNPPSRRAKPSKKQR